VTWRRPREDPARLQPLIRASRRGLPAGARTIRGLNPVVDATHTLFPELSPVLADLSFNAPTVARFLSVGGGALAADGGSSYADGIKQREHRLPQIAMIDAQSFRQLKTRPSDDRGNSYLAPNAQERAIGLGALETGDCDNVGGGQRDPNDGIIPNFPLQIEASPPCVVQPPSLLQGQQFPKIQRGKAQVTGPPAGRAGTRPATP